MNSREKLSLKILRFWKQIDPRLVLSIEYIGITPSHVLIYSAILYGLAAPVLTVVILHNAYNKKIMEQTQIIYSQTYRALLH